MSIYSIAQKKVLFFDDFIQQWGGTYQSHNAGSVNRIWSPWAGRDGVLQLQANNGYNSLRFNPNSLYIDSRKLVIEADISCVKNTGIQTFYFGLGDRHLGELPQLNGVYLTASTSDNQWYGYSYKGGVMLDSGVVASLSTAFQTVRIEVGSGVAVVGVGNSELELTVQNNFAASLFFGIVNTGISWPSLLLDWVEISR